MRYSTVNGVQIAEVPVEDFRVVLYDGKKKSMGKNRCNAGFFGNYKEAGELFTLPVGHAVCDYEATNKWTRYYCEKRGFFRGDRLYYSGNLNGKPVSTLTIKRGMAQIEDLDFLPPNCYYAIAGIPIMRGGQDVKFASYVKNQGWTGSELYGTWHIFVGIKAKSADTVYVMAMKTTTSNMILSAEAYKKFKTMGFYDVIKLDGGGSFYFNTDGKATSTLENRRVCTIIDMGEVDKSGNPYPVPTRTLRSGCKGDDVKWLQWELTSRGFTCSVDGRFGPATKTQVMAYQKANGLAVDGSCGPATSASIK